MDKKINNAKIGAAYIYLTRVLYSKDISKIENICFLENACEHFKCIEQIRNINAERADIISKRFDEQVSNLSSDVFMKLSESSKNVILSFLDKNEKKL